MTPATALRASVHLPPDKLDLGEALQLAGIEAKHAGMHIWEAHDHGHEPSDGVLRSTEAALTAALRAIAEYRGRTT